MWNDDAGKRLLIGNKERRPTSSGSPSSRRKAAETDSKRQTLNGSFLSPLSMGRLFRTPRERSTGQHELSSVLIETSHNTTTNTATTGPILFTPSSNHYDSRDLTKNYAVMDSNLEAPLSGEWRCVLDQTNGEPVPSPLVFEDGFENCLEISPPKSSSSSRTTITIGPICRICHDGDSKERFISPCNCSGSMARVHKSCLEKWLSSSTETKCEICHYSFPVKRIPRTFIEFLMKNDNMVERRAILSDIFCILVLTPLILGTAYMCVSGALGFNHWPAIPRNRTEIYRSGPAVLVSNDDTSSLNGSSLTWNKFFNFPIESKPLKKKKPLAPEEVFGLILLAVVLLVVYFGWIVMSIIYHHRAWRKWRSLNQRIVLIEPKAGNT